MRVPTGDHVARSVASVNRRVWLAEVMQKKLERFDGLYAPTYDQEWGAIPQTHRRFVRRIIESAPQRGCILDAACGTGRFFPMILESGRTLRGADWSVGMLGIARAKHPDVRIDCARLQALAFDAEYDGVICVDALENLPPEDWTVSLAGLGRAAKHEALIYVTVELPESTEVVAAAYERAIARGWPVVPGEVTDEDGYHYYPGRDEVCVWLHEAGLDAVDETDADGYRHLLCRRGSR